MLWSHAERETSFCRTATSNEAARRLYARASDWLRRQYRNTESAKRAEAPSSRAERPCKRNDVESQTGTGRALDAVLVQSKIEFQCHNSADVKIIEARGDRWACARRGGTRRARAEGRREGGGRREGAARQSRAAAEARARADMSLASSAGCAVSALWVSVGAEC